MKTFIFLFFISCKLIAGTYDSREVYPVVNDNYLAAALDLINSATAQIYICHFSWNPDSTTNKIKNAIYNAINRGVTVKVLLEDSLKQNSNIINELTGLHIPVKRDAKTEWPRHFLHTKLIIADSRRVLLGSTNLSYKAINENNETNLIINSGIIAEYYRQFVDMMWDHPEATADIPPVSDRHVTAAVNRGYFPIMKEYVSKAKKKIALIFYGMKAYPGKSNEVTDFIDDLIAARKRGVNVRVLLEKSSYDEKLNHGNEESINYLKSNGIDAKFDSPQKITHAKLILVDNTAVGVGSANFALSGFKFYNEACAVTTEPETIKYFWNYFENLWKEIK